MIRCLNCGQSHRVGACPRLLATTFATAAAASSTPPLQQRIHQHAIDLTASPSSTRNAIELLSVEDDDEYEEDSFSEEDRHLHDSSNDDDDDDDDDDMEIDVDEQMPPPATAAATTTALVTSPTNGFATDEGKEDEEKVQELSDTDASSSSEDDDRKVSAAAASTAIGTAPTNNSTSTTNSSTTDEEDSVDDDDNEDEDEVVECWQCPRCTLFNSSDRTICEACQSSRTVTATEDRHHDHHLRPAHPRYWERARVADPPLFHPSSPIAAASLATRVHFQIPTTTSTGSAPGMGAAAAALHRQRSTVYQHSSPPYQGGLDMTAEARLDRQRQHAAMITRQRQLLDRQRQLLDRQRRELDRQRRLHEQYHAAHTAIAAAADAAHQQHRAVVALPPQHHATHMLIAALAQSRSARPIHRYEAIMQAVRGGSRDVAPDAMSYDQLLQAFGNGTENMGASDGDIQQLPVCTVIDPDKDLPEDRRTCNICLEDFAAGDERRTLPCLHGYHKECSDKWLKTNASCPVCKHSIRE